MIILTKALFELIVNLSRAVNFTAFIMHFHLKILDLMLKRLFLKVVKKIHNLNIVFFFCLNIVI